MTDSVIAQLKKYAVFSRVNLSRDDALEVMGCAVLEITDTLAAVFGDTQKDSDQAIYIDDCLLVRVQDGNTAPRFEMIGTSKTISQLRQTLKEQYSEKTHEQWQLSEINAGIPTIYQETADLFATCFKLDKIN